MGMARDRAIAPITSNALELQNPKFRIPLDGLEQVLIAAKTELNIENIGLELSYKSRVCSLAQNGGYLSMCESISAAADFYNQYALISETVGRPQLVRRGDGIFIVWQENYNEHEKYRHVCELVFGGYVITVNWLSWCFARGVKSVSFRHSAPSDMPRHEFICKCPVRFGQAENSIELDGEFAEMELPSSAPDRLNDIQSILEKASNNIAQQSPFELVTFAYIVESINDGKISKLIVANKLGLDERTFQRRLKELDLTYREMLDSVRQSMCRDYIGKGKNFAEIAQILGFNDQSAFTRAFKKWHGVVPSQYEFKTISF
jgi:AraC-like DNA-binding protein